MDLEFKFHNKIINNTFTAEPFVIVLKVRLAII